MPGLKDVLPPAGKRVAVVNTAAVAAAMKNRDAFAYEDPQRSTRQQGIPHFYAFIRDPYHEYPVPPDYLCLPIKGMLRVPIELDTDTIFRMVYISYEVAAVPYSQRRCSGPFWPRYVDAPPYRAFHPNDTHLTYNSQVDVEVIVNSQRDQELYGGASYVLPSDRVTNLVPIASVKGIQEGMGMLRTEYLIPKGGALTIIFKSRADNPQAVNGYKINGFVYGLKYYG